MTDTFCWWPLARCCSLFDLFWFPFRYRSAQNCCCGKPACNTFAFVWGWVALFNGIQKDF